MRKLSVTLTALASFLVATPAMAAGATAELVDPNGTSGITADVTFHDNGSRLLVTGEAEGMDPTKRYISLIYDKGSASTGPNACIPPLPPPPNPLTFDQMQLSDWLPIGSSTRTLHAVRLGVAFVSLTRIGTVSIRRHDQTGPAAALPLQACGKVVPRR